MLSNSGRKVAAAFSSDTKSDAGEGRRATTQMEMDSPDSMDVNVKRDILYKAGLGKLNR